MESGSRDTEISTKLYYVNPKTKNLACPGNGL